MQLLGKEDQITDDTITSEEKWSLYVDQFVQLNSSDGTFAKRHEPFLRRNLPTQVGEDPPLNVETRSGLELKICVNTYKIFFVDNTEDYFRRKVSCSESSLLGLSLTEKTKSQESGRNQRLQKFHDWLNSSKGWKAGLSEPESLEFEKEYNEWKMKAA